MNFNQIFLTYIYLGDSDCANGADETNCTCDQNKFQCSDGRCVENRWRCGKSNLLFIINFIDSNYDSISKCWPLFMTDGWDDCFDGTDETIDLCKGEQVVVFFCFI